MQSMRQFLMKSNDLTAAKFLSNHLSERNHIKVTFVKRVEWNVVERPLQSVLYGNSMINYTSGISSDKSTFPPSTPLLLSLPS